MRRKTKRRLDIRKPCLTRVWSKRSKEVVLLMMGLPVPTNEEIDIAN